VVCSSFSSSLFLAYSQPSFIGCLPYFHTWYDLSANLGCRSEMCCTRLAENTGLKNRQKLAICAPSHNLSGCILATKAYIDNRKKLVKKQYRLHMSSQYGELRPTNGWDRLGCLGDPSKFQRVSCLGFVTAATSFTGDRPNFAQCLAVSWAGTLYIHFRGLLPPDGILPSAAKFTLRPSLAFSYIGSVTTRHSSSRRQPNLAAWYTEWNYRTFAESATYIWLGGHHVGHRPTF